MHSRIFCLVGNTLTEDEKQSSIENFEDLTEDTVFENLQCVADYVRDSDDLDGDIDWLCSFKDIFTHNSDTISINLNNVNTYLDDKLTELKNIVNEMIDGKEIYNRDYDITHLIDDKYSFYFIVDDTYDYYTYDEFLGMLVNQDKPCLEYKVVKTFDYHF